MECFDSQISILQAEGLGRTHDFEINKPLKFPVKGSCDKILANGEKLVPLRLF